MQESRVLSYSSAATATDAQPAGVGTAAVPEGFVPLRVKSVVRETRDAISIAFDIPESSVRQFGYQAGQFLTLLVRVDGREYRRCYSMSSAPASDEDLRITVKRDRDGVVSNWLNDTAAPGKDIHALPPQGRFVLKDNDRELIAFAGGSGITPVFSLLRSALMSGARNTRLYYANRCRDSVIFNEALAALEVCPAPVRRARSSRRRNVVYYRGREDLHRPARDAEYYTGAGPFMDVVQDTLRTAGVPADRVHLEHFEVAELPVPPPATGGDAVTEEVTIELQRRTITVRYSPGDTLLQMPVLAAPSTRKSVAGRVRPAIRAKAARG